MRAVVLVAALWLGASGAFGGEPSPEWRARTAKAEQLDIGESAPDWLVNSETYAFVYRPEDWEALAESKVAFITHCPVNADFFARCHDLGIRCFPYVTFYQGVATYTYQGVNLKDRPEFIEVDAEGNLKRSGFWESEDAKNMYTTCPNVEAYQEAMAAWVRQIMELGADGVFLDNLGSRQPCYGPEFGRHQHLYEDQNHAFAMLMKRAREIIKEYKPDGALLGNSANPPALPHEYWKYLDAEMLESYICTWVSTDRWFDWEDRWNRAGKDLQPYIEAGKQIQALSYLGHTPYGIREDAFFCYASARLAGFVWSGGLPLSNPETADLYRVRLGEALTGEEVENGVHYRVFRRGIVALNPDKERSAGMVVRPPAPTTRLLDLFGDTAKGWQPYGQGGYRVDRTVWHDGTQCIVCCNADVQTASGASQHIELDQTEADPVTVCGWSRAQDVSGQPDGDYALYVDVAYADGDHLYGQVAPFRTGTHDWELGSVTIRPEKPMKSMTLYALLRNKTGSAWFDSLSVSSEGGAELAAGGGFEDRDRQSRIFDAGPGGTLQIPAYSGRVYLFAPDTADAFARTGPRLTIATSPALGSVRFRVDGFDYWTHSGSWTTEYVLGPRFGKFEILLDQPGEHVVEVVDIVPADMETPAGYSGGERLGRFMDPSNPTRPSEGRRFRFRAWQGLEEAPKIEVDVKSDMTLTAVFDAEAPGP